MTRRPALSDLTMTLADLVQLQRGYDLTSEERRLGAIPVIGGGGPNGTHDKANVRGPGVVVVRSGSGFGNVWWVPQDYWAHNTVMYVKNFLGNDQRFAFYALSHIDFSSYNSGGAQPSLNRNFIADVPVFLPPLPEQRRIAAVLDAWDEAIATCEKLVAAKERRLILLREELLFGLEESPKVLRDVALVRTGVPAPQDAPAFAQYGPRFVRVNDLVAFAGEAKHNPEYLNADFAITAKLKLFPTGTILFAKSGMSASLGRVVALSEPAHIVSHLCAVNAKNADLQRFLFHWLTHLPPSSLIQGDGFPSIRKSEVEEMPFPEISEAEAVYISAILDEAKASVTEKKTLTSLLRTQKRGLMQKLLTGQWRVPESVAALMPKISEVAA